ncbi:nuclear transport factor 2 family protein [Sporosarcina sp. ITBMC105]
MENIQKVLDEYFAAWNEGFISKNGEGIRHYMSPEFVGYWAHANLNKPDEYGYNYDLDDVLCQYGKAEKSFETFCVTERKNGDEMIVVGRETNLINNEPYCAQCMFIWRKEEGEWKLLREYIELER